MHTVKVPGIVVVGLVGFLVAALVGGVWEAIRTPPRPVAAATGAGAEARTEWTYEELAERGRAVSGPRRILTPEELFEKASAAVVMVVVRDDVGKRMKTGSGFLVTMGGYVVTNYHVIHGACSVSVVLHDGREVPVEGLYVLDRHADLALIRLAEVPTGKHGGSDVYPLFAFLTPAESSHPKVGSKVYTIGSPRAHQNTFTNGLVSGIRTVGGVPMIQTSVPVGPGSSGGPLLNQYGEVVGVITLSHTGAQNLNLAAPVTALRDWLKATRRRSKSTGKL